MKRYLAILNDSFRETLDQRIFYILILFSLLIILGILSLSFKPKSTQEIIGLIVYDDVKGQVENFKETGKRDVYANISFTLVVYNSDNYFEQVAKWKRSKLTEIKKGDVRISTFAPISKTGTGFATVIEVIDENNGKTFRLDKDNIDSELTDFIRYHLARSGITKLDVKLKEDVFPEKRFEVSGEVNFMYLANSCKLSALFGAFDIGLPVSLAQLTIRLQMSLVNIFAGWIGILIALIVTAGFIPSMLQKGTVELWVSKPISRWGLLTYKYIGGLTFVFLNALVLIGGSFLAISFKTGFWNFWYLISIFVMVFFFAMLYTVSVFFGVLTRSPAVCILMALVTWFMSFLVSTTKIGLDIFGMVPDKVKTIVDVIYFIVPKTSEIKALNNYLLGKLAGIPQEMMDGSINTITGGDILQIVLTSLGFIAVTMFLACWIFSKKDY